jgi:glycine betaine/proline transport system substrate-binding protein
MINMPLKYDGQTVKEYSGDGSIEAYTTGIIGSSDYFVPKYFVDANPDFKDWSDLNKFKDQFATPETGSKGRLIGCAVAGWNCHDQKRLDLLGIDFEAVVSVPYDLSVKQVSASGAPGSLNVGAVLIMPEGFQNG